jgi:hypothetical protein
MQTPRLQRQFTSTSCIVANIDVQHERTSNMQALSPANFHLMRRENSSQIGPSNKFNVNKDMEKKVEFFQLNIPKIDVHEKWPQKLSIIFLIV